MSSGTTYIHYKDTKAFSQLVIDYLQDASTIRPFYLHRPDMQGLKDAIHRRKSTQPDRKALCDAIRHTHASLPFSAKQAIHLEALGRETSFTVCTAHQPNIFTGYLYFIYKILHTIRLADDLSKEMPEYHFVPIFWMGSEDNDLEELGQIQWYGEKLRWQTKQSGAVGRMKVDDALLQILKTMSGTMGVASQGPAVVSMLEEAYQKGCSIAEATFRFIQYLFGEYGLLVLQPDQAALKSIMVPVFREELTGQASFKHVAPVADALDQLYKAQVYPREINLFWLDDGVRNRIIRSGNTFSVDTLDMHFTMDEMLSALENTPEHFSPNVVLRGLYQEMALPNIAFIGGGSELAYWLELKELFTYFSVPLPVLILRNSFLLMRGEDSKQLQQLGWQEVDLFRDMKELMDGYARSRSDVRLDVDQELAELEQLYRLTEERARKVDVTLVPHVQSLRKKAMEGLKSLEPKLLRAERRKHEETSRKLEKLKSRLFPAGKLQERHENILPYLSEYGTDFIGKLYTATPSLEMRFGIIEV